MNKHITLISVASAFLGLAASSANAATIYEDFNYTPSQALAGQNGGTGLTGAWTTPGAFISSATVVSGLSFGSNLATSGNAVQLTTVGGSGGWGPDGVTTRGVTAEPAGPYWGPILSELIPAEALST